MKTKRPPTLIQTAREAAKAAGARLYSRQGVALAVGLLKKGSSYGDVAPRTQAMAPLPDHPPLPREGQ